LAFLINYSRFHFKKYVDTFQVKQTLNYRKNKYVLVEEIHGRSCFSQKFNNLFLNFFFSLR